MSGLCSCRQQGSDEPHPATLYNICEISRSTLTGCELTLYRPDSDTPILLRADNTPLLNDEGLPLQAGQSVIVGYLPHNGRAYQNDDIDILTWGKITSRPMEVANYDSPDDGQLDGWDHTPVELISAWRAGGKLIFRLKLNYQSAPRQLALKLDHATDRDPIPTAYLYHAADNTTPTFDRNYYIAFDISGTWSDPNLQALDVKVANAGGQRPQGILTLRFDKNAED